MASPEVLDFESLLAPIPGDHPAGVALREDYSPTAVYHRIKDARAAAREAERSVVFGDETGPETKADWRPILQLCPPVLAEQSKDLEVAAWLIEALVREHGFAGLRDGLRLICGLVDRYWDRLYPLPDEDGVLTRVAPLAGLNGVEGDGVLVTPITNIPITQGNMQGPYSVSDYRQATDLQQLPDPDKRQQRIAQGAVSMQMFEAAVTETSEEFFRDLFEDICQGAKQFAALCELLEEKCGCGEDGYSLAPPSSNLRNALEACRETVATIARHVLEVPEEEEAEEEGGAIMHVEGESGIAARQVQTREDAFRALLQVADFFRRTEPHSPVAYALEQAVRWGKMPLPDLLAELVPDVSYREQIFKHVGIRIPEEE